MVRPGATLVNALGGLTLAALTVALWPPLAWLVLLAALGLAAAALAEAHALGRVRLQVEWPPRSVLSLGEEECLRAVVSVDTHLPLRLRARQVWPQLLGGDAAEIRGVSRPGETLTLEFRVRGVARGLERLAPTWIAMTHRGWVERLVAAGGPSEVQVLPNLQAVRRMHRELNQFALRGLGQRAARLGKGREFDRLRDYVTGDEFRDVAWKASARHGRLIVREFRLERSQDIVLCLDRGHRMAARVGGLTRLDHAVNAAVLLAYIGNRMEDRVGLISFAADVEPPVAPGRGAAHLRRLTAVAGGLEPGFLHSDYSMLGAALGRRLRHRSLVLLLTTLPELAEEDALVRAVERLVPRHLPLVIALGDRDLEARARMLPSGAGELARTLVARDVVQAREQVARELRRRGALVVESTPDDAGIDAVNAYMEVKRRQLL